MTNFQHRTITRECYYLHFDFPGWFEKSMKFYELVDWNVVNFLHKKLYNIMLTHNNLFIKLGIQTVHTTVVSDLQGSILSWVGTDPFYV